MHINAHYEDDEDIIEQTFGMADDQRNNQVFQDLPTPKSRMKREIDIEKDNITTGAGSGQNQQNRKKIFDEGKRQSEHNVIDKMWGDSSENPAALAKNQLYAASQKNIDTGNQTSQSKTPQVAVTTKI